MRTQEKLEKLVSNRTDSSVSVDEEVEAAGRGPFLFPTYLGRSKGLCSQGNFSQECEWFKEVFSKLKYPQHPISSTVKQLVDSKVSDQQHIPLPQDNTDTIGIMLPFKDQDSANVVKKRLNNLSLKVKRTIQPVFVSHKLNEDLKVREVKPAIVNQQCLVYDFQCNLCDAGYIGYTRGHNA